MERATSEPAEAPDLSPWQEQPGMGRAILVGSAIGVVISFVGVTAGMLAYGIEWGSAVGLGAFVAFWGGLGFGSMMGGVVWASRPDVPGPIAAAAPVATVAPVAAATADPANVDLTERLAG